VGPKPSASGVRKTTNVRFSMHGQGAPHGIGPCPALLPSRGSRRHSRTSSPASSAIARYVRLLWRRSPSHLVDRPTRAAPRGRTLSGRSFLPFACRTHTATGGGGGGERVLSDASAHRELLWWNEPRTRTTARPLRAHYSTTSSVTVCRSAAEPLTKALLLPGCASPHPRLAGHAQHLSRRPGRSGAHLGGRGIGSDSPVGRGLLSMPVLV